jgi:competence protein ComEC
MTASKTAFYFSLLFIGGIFIGSFIVVSLPWLLGFLIFGILMISLFWQKNKKLVMLGFCFLFLTAGFWRQQLAESEIVYPKEQNIAFTGVVVKEPDIRANNIKLTLKTEEIKGKILITASRYPEYYYGDKLMVSGKLQPAPKFEDFNYRDYLAKEGIYSVMYYPKVEKIGRSNGFANSIMGGILTFKDRLRKSIYQNLSPPQSSILGAMILGDKRKISPEWKEKLNRAGVRHITAVSGLHVAVLTTILMTIFLGLNLNRGIAFYSAVILITFFIIMTGIQPSAVRAGIMGGLFLLAQYLGRPNLSVRTIVFAASAMLFFNPLLLMKDVGFQLSFLAMLGIIYLTSLFQRRLSFLPEMGFFNLRSILAMTLAAYFFTLPILIYNFGSFSLAGLAANILIVPGLYWIMLLGFIFGLAGMVWQFLGWILSFPAWFLLTYLIKIVDWFSGLPLAFLSFEISWPWLAISYFILAGAVWWLNRKKQTADQMRNLIF